jgi:hypothetical protein
LVVACSGCALKPSQLPLMPNVGSVNQMLSSDLTTMSLGAFSVFREPSNYANGNTRDRQGRLVTCEHSVTRRITRTEFNGSITVLADQYQGKRLNAPFVSSYFMMRLLGMSLTSR